MRMLICAATAGLLAAVPVTEVAAQSLGTVIKREAEREGKRQAQRRTREAVQCATGARDCLPDDGDGDGGGAKDARPAPPASGGQAAGAPSPNAVLDPFAPSAGQGSASTAAAAPFTVLPIAGATATDHQAGTLSSYRRITGYKPKLISYQDHTGLLTRTRYELSGGQTPSAMIAAWREPLLRQGFTVEWQCSRKAQCGTSAYHQLGAGYMPVNGINLGIAGDVEYFTAKRALPDQPTVYVAIALSRSVAYVDVIEMAP